MNTAGGESAEDGTGVPTTNRPQRRKKQYVILPFSYRKSTTFHIYNTHKNPCVRYAVSVQWERQQEEEKEQGHSRPLFTGTFEDCYKCCCCAKRVGNMFFLYERRDGSPLVVAGPCWPFCVFITLPLILILSALVTYFVFFADMDGMRRLVRP